MQKKPFDPILVGFFPNYKKFLKGLTDILYQNIGESFYQKILDLALEFCPSAQAGSIMELREDERYHFVAACGFDLKVLQAVTLTLDETILLAPADQHSFLLHNLNDFSEKHLDLERHEIFLSIGKVRDIKETLCIPIRQGKKIVAGLGSS